MIFVLSQSALALTCDAGDALCNDVNDMQAIVNAEFAGNPATDAIAGTMLTRLQAAVDAIDAAGCTYDGFLAGRWAGRAGTLSGDSTSGSVSGTLAGGDFSGTLGATAFGDGFSSIHTQSKRIVANIGDDGLAAGSFFRVSGRIGGFFGVTATCPGGTAPADAIDPWFPGDLSGWTGGGGPLVFDFRTDPPASYDRVDRMGMPAVNTALITAPNKNAYNLADPADDIAGAFVPDIVGSLAFLHGALDDDLTGLTLVPCTEPGDGSGSCTAQGAPLVLPDTLKLDPGQPAGFPNGRLPADPVIDVTLAVILLDLSVPGQDAFTFANLPLNPPANDVPFAPSFPFMAPAH